MRLETFVDIMGINVIQVIERIQQRGESFDRPPCPDDYINPDWQQNISNRRADKPIHAVCNETASGCSNGVREEKSTESLNVPSTSRSAHEDLTLCPSHGDSNDKKDSKGCSNTLHGMKQVDIDGSPDWRSNQQRMNTNVCRTTNPKHSSDAKGVSTSVWRRPNSLRLLAPKDFIKASVRTHSDAVKVISRGTRNLSKTEQTDSYISLYEENTEIFSEILPPHITFYNKFHT